jgi:hypothetical protein
MIGPSRVLTLFDGSGNILATETSIHNHVLIEAAGALRVRASDYRQLSDLAKKHPTATIGTIDRAKFVVVGSSLNFLEYAP